jgi:hypothetical protein
MRAGEIDGILGFDFLTMKRVNVDLKRQLVTTPGRMNLMEKPVHRKKTGDNESGLANHENSFWVRCTEVANSKSLSGNVTRRTLDKCKEWSVFCRSCVIVPGKLSEPMSERNRRRERHCVNRASRFGRAWRIRSQSDWQSF